MIKSINSLIQIKLHEVNKKPAIVFLLCENLD